MVPRKTLPSLGCCYCAIRPCQRDRLFPASLVSPGLPSRRYHHLVAVLWHRGRGRCSHVHEGKAWIPSLYRAGDSRCQDAFSRGGRQSSKRICFASSFTIRYSLSIYSGMSPPFAPCLCCGLFPRLTVAIFLSAIPSLPAQHTPKKVLLVPLQLPRGVLVLTLARLRRKQQALSRQRCFSPPEATGLDRWGLIRCVFS